MSKYITIDGFESLTKQQMFDISAKHILSTGKPSYVNNNNGLQGCVYQGSGCAAAPFIREEERKKADEPKFYFDTKYPYSGWGDLASNNLVPRHHQDLVADFQVCHDTYASKVVTDDDLAIWLSNWKVAMRRVAKIHELDPSILDS